MESTSQKDMSKTLTSSRAVRIMRGIDANTLRIPAEFLNELFQFLRHKPRTTNRCHMELFHLLQSAQTAVIPLIDMAVHQFSHPKPAA